MEDMRKVQLMISYWKKTGGKAIKMPYLPLKINKATPQTDNNPTDNEEKDVPVKKLML